MIKIGLRIVFVNYVSQNQIILKKDDYTNYEWMNTRF